ncbi:HAD family hydrolase [Oceanospirillum sediminis]|uniref:HAD family hydrolase n=1 Tax=Oceanospirillum sediminis TaxID=2760088 RepID=UPI0034D27D70
MFDLDGTLLSSDLNFQLLRELTGCPAGGDILAHIDSLECEQQKQQAHDIVREHEMRDAGQSHWLPGAREMVYGLKQHGFQMAIVTRNISDAAKLKMSHNQVPIELVLSREDAPAKPDPTALLQIARYWQLPVDQIIYVGDFRYDVEAANNAGMVSCLYAPEVRPDYASQADMMVTHFDDLAEQLLNQSGHDI